MGNNNGNEASLGVYTHSGSSKNFEKFSRQNEAGRVETEYVHKSHFGSNSDNVPQEIEVVIKWGNNN